MIFVSGHSSDLLDNQHIGALTVNRGLAAQLFQHLGRASKSVTRFANGDVEDELLDAKLSHGVGALFDSFRLYSIRI
jgi:hypothetical protein